MNVRARNKQARVIDLRRNDDQNATQKLRTPTSPAQDSNDDNGYQHAYVADNARVYFVDKDRLVAVIEQTRNGVCGLVLVFAFYTNTQTPDYDENGVLASKQLITMIVWMLFGCDCCLGHCLQQV